MRRTGFILLLLVAFAASGRTRSQTRFSPDPWLPALAYPMKQLMAIAGVPSVQQLGIRVTILTGEPNVTYPKPQPRPIRDYSDREYLAQHARYMNGAFYVPLFQMKGDCYKPRQIVTVPAQPDQIVTTILDLSMYGDDDLLLFEAWPGFDQVVELQIDGEWKWIATMSYTSDSVAAFEKTQVTGSPTCQ